MKKFKSLFYISIVLLITILSNSVYADEITETKDSSYAVTELKSENKKDVDLEIHFINPNSRVDAIYIKVGDKSMFVDGGFYRDAKVETDYLKSIGVTQIDYYIGSHGHSDHVGAGGPIIKNFGIKTIYAAPSKSSGQNSVYKMILRDTNREALKTDKSEILKAVRACKVIPLKAGNELEINDLKIKCLGPVNVKSVGFNSVSENYNSLILKLQYGGASFLLTGDAPSGEISDTNKKFPGELDATVFKNPHHNAQLPIDYIKLSSPKYVIFTTKDGYLPSSFYLESIKKLGAKTYIVTNKKDRNVVVKSDGDSVSVTAKGKTDTTKIEYKVTLDKTNINLKTGRSKTLKAINIKPKNSVIKWTSSDENIATVDETGKVTGVKEGMAVITARNNTSAVGCLVTVEDPPETKPIYNYTKTGKVLKEYKDDSINVKIEEMTKYYVTKIWVEEPYKQINKKSADWNKSLSKVSSLLNGTEDGIVGINGSGYYLSSSGIKPAEEEIKNLGKKVWDKTTEGYLVLTNGIINRKIDGQKTNALLGITPNGTLKYYENNDYADVINDGVRNTFTYGPLLIKDGVKYTQTEGKPRCNKDKKTQRSTIGQVDENNYIMITTKGSKTATLDEVADLGIELNCKILYNLCGGSSTTLWYRNELGKNGKEIRKSSQKVGDTIYFSSTL